MASVKIFLRKKINAKGEYPLTIRITKNRKSSYMYIGQYIDEKHFDSKNQRVRKSHPNSTRLNNLLLKKLAEANDKLLSLETEDDPVSAQVVKKHVKKEINPTGFFELANIYMKDLQKAGKFNRLSADKPRINHFRKFLKNREVLFSEIDVSTLKKFQVYLKDVRGVGQRTVVNSYIVIRTIFNIAIREGIVEQKYYPFGKGKIVIKFPESVKLGLSVDEMKVLENLKYEVGSMKWHSLNVWLTSFYFAGMRVSDVLLLKWSDFNDGRLNYKMGKNDKVLSLKIPNKASAILTQYESQRTTNGDFIFPEMQDVDLDDVKQVFLKKKASNKKFNKYLKRIAEDIGLEKPLTMHISRHSFANISGDKIPIQMLQKLYRHSNLTTTINYQKNFIYKDADEALDAVIDF